MAISVNVTHVWWSKSPSRKPVMSDARIRLGLLMVLTGFAVKYDIDMGANSLWWSGMMALA